MIRRHQVVTCFFGALPCSEAHSNRRTESMQISSSVLDAVCASFCELERVRPELQEAQEAAQKLQNALGSKSRVNLILEVPPSKVELQKDKDLNSLFPIDKTIRSLATVTLFSPTLLYSLFRGVPHAYRLSRMLTDTFALTDERTVDDHHDRGAIPIEDAPAQKNDLYKDVESIPDWFPYAQNPSTPVPQVEDVVCDQYIIETLTERSGNYIAKV